jgi:hypothetical protein
MTDQVSLPNDEEFDNYIHEKLYPFTLKYQHKLRFINMIFKQIGSRDNEDFVRSDNFTIQLRNLNRTSKSEYIFHSMEIIQEGFRDYKFGLYRLRDFIKFNDVLKHIDEIINHELVHLSSLDNTTLRGYANTLTSELTSIISEIRAHFIQENISIDYFAYLDLYNYKVYNLINHNKPTPGTFRLFTVNTIDKNKQVLSHLKNNGLIVEIGRFSNVDLDPYDRDAYYNYIQSNDLLIKEEEDPDWERYIGWNKEELAQALVDAGVFDSKITPVEAKVEYDIGENEEEHVEYMTTKYQIEFPKLLEIGISNSYLTQSDDPAKIIKTLPRYALETIYLNTVDVTPDWDELCKFGSSENIKELAYREYGVEISGTREELCRTLKGIARNKELGLVLPEITEDFIMYPGDVGNPRVQYKKYIKAPENFKLVENIVDIEKYLYEVKDICQDISKTSRDVYQLAMDIGIQRYLKKDMNNADMCKIIEKYLDVIRRERKL